MNNTILAIGAAGEEVDRLSSLLGALGIRIAKTGETLDADMMADVQKAKDWLEIVEPEFDGVKGDLIGDFTWKGLEAAAKAALGLSPVTEVPPRPPSEPVAPVAAEQEPATGAKEAEKAPGDSEETPAAADATVVSGRFAQSQQA